MIVDLAEQLAIAANRHRHFFKLRAFTRERGVFAVIGDNGGIADPALKLGKALLDAVELFQSATFRPLPPVLMAGAARPQPGARRLAHVKRAYFLP